MTATHLGLIKGWQALSGPFTFSRSLHKKPAHLSSTPRRLAHFR
jgi:hypothetical protein